MAREPSSKDIGGVSFTLVEGEQTRHAGYVLINAVVSPDDLKAPFDPAKGKMAEQVFKEVEMLLKRENPRYLVMREKDDAGTSNMALWVKGPSTTKEVKRMLRSSKLVTDTQDTGVTFDKVEKTLQKLHNYYGASPEAESGASTRPTFAHMLDANARLNQKLQEIIQAHHPEVATAVKEELAGNLMTIIEEGTRTYTDQGIASRAADRQHAFGFRIEDKILAAMEAKEITMEGPQREKLIAALKQEVMGKVKAGGITSIAG